MRQKIHQNVFSWLCLASAFALPVWGRLLPPLIALMFLNWLVSGIYLKTFRELIKNRQRRNTLMFTGLYLLYLAGLIYSSDFEYAWFDLEVKLSLLVFPLIFATSDISFLDKSYLRKLMLVYLAGCLSGTGILIAHALVQWMNGIGGAFYYIRLSWHFHSGYISMYLNFAIAFIMLDLLHNIREIRVWLKWTYFFLLLWFFIFIFLLSSKTGLITMVILAVLASVDLAVKQKKLYYSLGLIIIFLMFLRAGLHIFSGTSERMAQSREALNSNSDSEAGNSTSDRINIWKISLEIIRSNIFLGVGTGDVKDVLLGKYRERNITHALEYKLNAHDQYLQTFMTLGLPGFLTLVLMLVLPGIVAFRKEHYLYFLFLLIFSINILVESMLETQAGVVWYGFFNVILFSVKRRGE